MFYFDSLPKHYGIRLKHRIMYKLTIEENSYCCQADETVLDALLRKDVAISYSCKKGTCHSCIVSSPDITPPETAQAGLKNTLKKLNYFLACQCHPEQDMKIKLPNQAEFYSEGTVIVTEMLNRNTLLLSLTFKDTFKFNAGQFVNLQRADGLTRSYSIANTPQKSNILEFNIRRLPNGQFSEWLHNDIKVGDTIAVSEANGSCFYLPEKNDQNILLIGTGTGLAPLAGILTDALAQEHSGSIYLFHGSREVEDLYRIDEMQQLDEEHENFHYIPCLSGEDSPEGFSHGRVNEVAFALLPDLKDWRVFLCGNPDMVKQMKKMTFLKGAASANIYADAFFISPA